MNELLRLNHCYILSQIIYASFPVFLFEGITSDLCQGFSNQLMT